MTDINEVFVIHQTAEDMLRRLAGDETELEKAMGAVALATRDDDEVIH